MTDQSAHGSLQEEVAKLAAVLSARLQPTETAAKSRAGDWTPAADAARPVACELCPICQLIALVRGERTESIDKLLGSAMLLISALTDHLQPSEAAPEPAESPSRENSAPPSRPSAPSTPRVLRINVE